MTEALVLALEVAPAQEDPAPDPLSLDEAAFRAFYARTAGPLRAFIRHQVADDALADDLLQETFYRLLRARRPDMDEAERRAYTYRIAVNLVRDQYRGARGACLPLPESLGAPDAGERVRVRADLEAALRELKPHQRRLLWMAYVEGASHEEIARVTGRKRQSIRPLLFRARRRLADLLRGRGLAPEARGSR